MPSQVTELNVCNAEQLAELAKQTTTGRRWELIKKQAEQAGQPMTEARARSIVKQLNPPKGNRPRNAYADLALVTLIDLVGDNKACELVCITKKVLGYRKLAGEQLLNSIILGHLPKPEWLPQDLVQQRLRSTTFEWLAEAIELDEQTRMYIDHGSLRPELIG
ncbi:MAG: hypothetical protein AAF918_17010 [Pseudomonadota bacterium]